MQHQGISTSKHGACFYAAAENLVRSLCYQKGAILRFAKGAGPNRVQLRSAFAASGKAVEKFLRRRLLDGKRVKMFKGQPVRWMAYMIAHESHHRGSIMLALKQNGMRMPEKVAIGAVWYTWYFGEV